MSWSFQTTDAELNDAQPHGEVSPQVQDQVDAAKYVARALLSSGAVGDGDKAYRVSLSGHANPNHEPAEGYANDCVTVSVSQV